MRIGRLFKELLIPNEYLVYTTNPWSWKQLQSEYCAGRISIIPTGGASSRRVKLKFCSANFVKCLCCVLVRVAIRELSNVVFEEHMKNSFLCVNKLNTAFTFHCIWVNGTPLTWPKQHKWLRRPGGL